jgi:hypothetical protein
MPWRADNRPSSPARSRHGHRRLWCRWGSPSVSRILWQLCDRALDLCFTARAAATTEAADVQSVLLMPDWVLNNSFLRMTWHIGTDAGVSIGGIDPATGKLAFLAFDDKGRVWNIAVVAQAGE